MRAGGGLPRPHGREGRWLEVFIFKPTNCPLSAKTPAADVATAAFTLFRQQTRLLELDGCQAGHPLPPKPLGRGYSGTPISTLAIGGRVQPRHMFAVESTGFQIAKTTERTVMSKIRKALAAGALAGLTALVPLLMGGKLSQAAVLAVVAAVVSGFVVYLTPNAAV